MVRCFEANKLRLPHGNASTHLPGSISGLSMSLNSFSEDWLSALDAVDCATVARFCQKREPGLETHIGLPTTMLPPTPVDITRWGPMSEYSTLSRVTLLLVFIVEATATLCLAGHPSPATEAMDLIPMGMLLREVPGGSARAAPRVTKQQAARPSRSLLRC
jgi:hypothetical protein